MLASVDRWRRAALLEVADELGAIGALRYGVEAACESAVAFLRETHVYRALQKLGLNDRREVRGRAGR